MSRQPGFNKPDEMIREDGENYLRRVAIGMADSQRVLDQVRAVDWRIEQATGHQWNVHSSIIHDFIPGIFPI